MKYQMFKIIALIGIALGGLVIGQGQAQAANGWVYVVVNNNHCTVGGASVKSIDIHVTRPVSWYLYKDNGDNIVYPQVTLNSTNYMDITFYCKTSSGADGGSGYISQANIYPTQTGQTFWK